VTAHDLLIFPAIPAVEDCGELAIRSHYPQRPGPRGWVTIDRADPRVFIPAHDVQAMARGDWQAFAKVWSTGEAAIGDSLDGSKLEIRGEDARVIYMLTERFDLDGYIAEWPD
jgi:hypothetical protein